MNKESENNAAKIADKKMEQVSGGCVPVNLPEGTVITDDFKCKKCGYICPTGKPPYRCPVCGGSDWEKS